MVDQTPRLGLDDYDVGDQNWDHSDTVETVDEYAIDRGRADQRPAEGSYDDELFFATDQQLLWRWDDPDGRWVAVSGVGTDANHLPAVHTDAINTRRSSSRWLDGHGGDESAQMTAMIEAAAQDDGSEVRVESGTYHVENPVAPVTDGSPVVLRAMGQVTVTRDDTTFLALYDCPNLHLRGNWRVEGVADLPERNQCIRGANDFSFDRLEIDGGGGGLAPAQNVFGRELVVRAIESDDGHAAAFNAQSSADFVRINWLECHGEEKTERAVEIEDGASNVWLPRGRVRGIVSNRASSPRTVTVTGHDDKPDTENIYLGEWHVEDSVQGFRVQDDTGYAVRNVCLSNITTRRIDPTVYTEGDPKASYQPTKIRLKTPGSSVQFGTLDVGATRGGWDNGPNSAHRFIAENGTTIRGGHLTVRGTGQWNTLDLSGDIHVDAITTRNAKANSNDVRIHRTESGFPVVGTLVDGANEGIDVQLVEGTGTGWNAHLVSVTTDGAVTSELAAEPAVLGVVECGVAQITSDDEIDHLFERDA